MADQGQNVRSRQQPWEDEWGATKDAHGVEVNGLRVGVLQTPDGTLYLGIKVIGPRGGIRATSWISDPVVARQVADELALCAAKLKRPMPEGRSVSRGQWWRDRWGALIEVVRVARDGSWADIHVHQTSTGSKWSKRQPLPFPFSWERDR